MRRSGILMPVFSLPSPYGVGTLGQAARDFIDFLEASGQSCWQVLPIGPTSYGDSPYQSYSSFAGNPYFIDLDDLAEDGLLDRADYAGLNWGDPGYIDYGLLYQQRFPVLRKACAKLLADPPADYADFLAGNALWLTDYALFMALKNENGGASWAGWDEPLRRREPHAMAEAALRLKDDVAFWQAVQYLFTRQWNAMKELANSKGISIIGDVPIYVAPDSADVWANPHLFQLDGDLTPTDVAGCPPDAFCEDGQLWGNPLFDWDEMAKDGYAWWMDRIEFQFRICDILRIDHFRGFDAYYAIPYGDENARRGVWREGPGKHFFATLNEKLGRRNIIAEDLGFLTESVHELLAFTGYPGMKVLQFAFDVQTKDSDYLPHRCPANCVAYSGTHDNETAAAWLESMDRETLDYVTAYMRLNEAEGLTLGVVRTLMATPADLAVIQMQDLLGLGAEARINTPSTTGENWKWRLLPGQITAELTAQLRADTETYSRLPR